MENELDIEVEVTEAMIDAARYAMAEYAISCRGDDSLFWRDAAVEIYTAMYIAGFSEEPTQKEHS